MTNDDRPVVWKTGVGRWALSHGRGRWRVVVQHFDATAALKTAAGRLVPAEEGGTVGDGVALEQLMSADTERQHMHADVQPTENDDVSHCVGRLF
ncbi:hypothetical protein AQF52_2979 [Streptomyces venezuelae]|nr:hypothetical protein AQF52_2979 [Streptomyces venezuelae]